MGVEGFWKGPFLLKVPPDPNLPDLLCLPCNLLARPLPAPQVHRREAGHRHDHPPHPHLHVFQRAQVFPFSFFASLCSFCRSVPRVSYVTCLDIWMVSCILFVFIELVDITFVGFSLLINLPQIEFSAIFFLTDNIKNRTWIITTIDRLTLVLLPATFATMNALYWPYLLNPYSTQFDFELI